MGNDADTLFQVDEFEWGMMHTHCFRRMSLNGE
jgi:hypothetical protein